MNQVVVDASVICKLFAADEERHVAQAASLIEDGLAETVRLVAPELMYLEVLNVASRRWRFEESQVDVVARAIDDIGIDVRPVDLSRVGAWTGTGLSAYDAAYVVVAEELGATLYTDDAQIVELAPEYARSIAQYERT